MSKPLYPPIKYPGGKRQLVPEFLKRFPDDISLLCEPFFGGGSLGLRLAGEGRLRKLIAGEACGPVRAFWQALADHPDALATHIKALSEPSKRMMSEPTPLENFLDWRGVLNGFVARGNLGPLTGALFYALNRTCNNGIVRFNQDGEFNVPIGKKQDGSFHRFKPDFKHLDRCRRALRGAGFEIYPSWLEAMRQIPQPGWAIYLDPPYTGGFVGYTPEGWHSDDDILLYTEAARYGQDHRLVLSQPDTEWARDCCSSLLKGWQVDRVEVGRPANSDGKGRGPVGELLIWNKPAERAIVDIKPQIAGLSADLVLMDDIVGNLA
jgi:DNA adenine methylase